MVAAQFVAITSTDRTFALPGEAHTNDREFPLFDLPGLDFGRTALLMFKVKANGSVRLMMVFNSSEPDINFQFDSSQPDSAPRSWHEIVPGKHLRATDNQFVVAVTGGPFPPGRVELSDIVIFYHTTG